jgi:hypothetical protein
VQSNEEIAEGGIEEKKKMQMKRKLKITRKKIFG